MLCTLSSTTRMHKSFSMRDLRAPTFKNMYFESICYRLHILKINVLQAAFITTREHTQRNRFHQINKVRI